MKVDQSCLTLQIPWTVQSLEFSKIEYWSGQPFPSPGDLPSPEVEPRFPSFQADSLPAEPQREAPKYCSGQSVPSPVDLLDSGIEPGCLALQADSLPTELLGKFSYGLFYLIFAHSINSHIPRVYYSSIVFYSILIIQSSAFQFNLSTYKHIIREKINSIFKYAIYYFKFPYKLHI